MCLHFDISLVVEILCLVYHVRYDSHSICSRREWREKLNLKCDTKVRLLPNVCFRLSSLGNVQYSREQREIPEQLNTTSLYHTTTVVKIINKKNSLIRGDFPWSIATASESIYEALHEVPCSSCLKKSSLEKKQTHWIIGRAFLNKPP